MHVEGKAKKVHEKYVLGGWHSEESNHSLCATGATSLFNAGVSENLIHDVTGHRSNALQLYEHPSVIQQQSVSRVSGWVNHLER